MTQTVTLPGYFGPLDLLLYLVRRHEVDVLGVPLAAVADQFREYVEVVKELDLEAAGEFLVVAATLMEIKSRALLPADDRAADADDRPDPRRDLVKQLLQYRKFKDAAAALEDRAVKHAERVGREAPPEPGAAPAGPSVRPVELWDLVSAFARLMRETQAAGAMTVTADDTPQHVYEAEVTGRVRAAGRVAFREVFGPPFNKPRLIGLFLAILELVRNHGLGLEHPDPGGEIWLVKRLEE
ncbi:MAG: segregation/condensation protein A [Gemmataceae bacterium]|nr:segregation/condensation protein A [Gemmataceae bacterium]